MGKPISFPIWPKWDCRLRLCAALPSKTEAEQAARDLGPRVVMKIDTARVVHKSDVGGVALGVTPETAARTYEQLLACLDPPLGTFPGEGVVVAAQ